MGFFTPGNLITLGIVILVLVLYRQIDRNNRPLKLLRDYSERLKKDLNVYVKEQEKAVKDYSISLNVEKDSAKELMKRLQMTEEEMAKKVQAMARIESQIKTYESSLAELDRMTGRVQENMNRVREESVFVDTTGKRISEVKEKLLEFEKGLSVIKDKFEKENAESLGNAADKVLASVKTSVTELGTAADSIKHRVEDYRQALAKTEETRTANMARDTEFINKILARAVEQAGKRADKMEEAALVSLKGQAEERMLKLKTAEEERLKGYQESAKARIAEVQGLIKSLRDEWRAERSELESKDRALLDEHRKGIEDFVAMANASKNQMHAEWHAERSGLESADKALREERTKDIAEINAVFDASKKQIEEYSVKANEIVSSQEAQLVKAAEEMKQKALEANEARLEEYRRAQEVEFRRLETLSDDSRKLDAELRRHMQEALDRQKDEFTQHEKESAELRKIEADKFTSSASHLRDELVEIEKNLAALKSASFDKVSENLKSFEDEFFADLTKRSGNVDVRLLEWQDGLERRLARMGEDAENTRRELEHSLLETVRKNFSTQEARLVSDLEHLKADTGAFEEAIRVQMNAAEDSVSSFKDQLDRDLEETRKEADVSIRAEMGKHSITTAETVKKYQRELGDAQEGLAAKLRDLDTIVEDARRRVRDLATETDNRIASVRSSVEDAERHIREAVDQTKLVDKANELALNAERRIEDLKGDMERLEQRRAEAAQLENDIVKLKRLEDDVNAKMTKFNYEKRSIEAMEANFNRLLQISKAVEEKLTEVTSSDDVLQGVQLQIRRLEEALGTAEEKYLRIERKSQILDNTNDGIDRNFRALQDSEKLSEKIGGDLDRYAEDLDLVKISIEKLADKSEKAALAVDRMDVLDDSLDEIEERIKSMQRARQWIAEAETRLEDLNKQAQIQARAIDSMVKGKKSGVPVNLGEGTKLSPLQLKEAVISLARQKWTKEEIAKNMKISVGEVDLILEMAPRD